MSNHKPHTAEPLAIVGIGCKFPQADSVAAYWSNIKEGVDAITEIPDSHWDPEDYFDSDKNIPDMTYARRGGFIDPVAFDPLLYGMSPNNIEATDTTQLFGMVAAREALLDAGYATGKESNDGRPFDRDRTSVILGVTGTLELVIPLGARLGHPLWRKALRDAGVDDTTADDVVERIAEGYVPWQENSFPGLLGNVAAGRIANRFDLGGTNCVVDAACASSLSAIHLAAMELQSGQCDMAITGGLDTFNDIFMYMCFSKTPALSPTGNSRPFHIDGDGTILGEGLGVIILKRLSDAQRDADKIYAVIRGIGASSDGRGNAIYAPSASGQQKALRRAYAEAGITPHTIELVEAHGTGTKVGDAVETESLSNVFRDDQADGTWCAIGSVKSMIGHTKAAAGVAGLIKIALALQHKVLPPTIKVDQPLEILEPGKAPVYVNTIKRPWVTNPDHPRRAAVSAFGFGGSNFHALLEEAEKGSAIEWDGRVLIFAFSSENNQDLRARLDSIDTTQDWKYLRRTAARSIKDYDPKQPCRLAFVVEYEHTDLNKLIKTASTMLTKQEDATEWNTPDGACFRKGKPSGKLGFLFPGQGSQYPGMLRDLACQFPQMLSSLDRVNSILGNQGNGRRLTDYIYPIPVFNETALEKDKEALRATTIAQPAIGAVSAGAIKILEHFAVKADAVAGHSFGELTALMHAGRFDEESFYRLAQKRGELMQQGEGDRGSMLAVIATPEKLYNIIEEHQLDLIIANHNAPSQVVLSGATDQINKAEAILSEQNIRVRGVPVSAAFHSSFVADAEKPFGEFINKFAFNPGKIPVYSNTTTKTYPKDPNRARALLAGQLAQPVEFVNQIENMYAAGIRTFVEIGPSNIVSSLASACLGGQAHHVIALDASRGQRSGQYDLAVLLAQLSVTGYECDLYRWDAGYLDQIKDEKPAAMSISISGANYVMPREKRAPVVKQQAQTVAAAIQQETSAMTREEPITPVQSAPANEVLRATQESILALQKLQEQTAQLHKQYLDGQEQAQQTIRQLIQQQQSLLTATPVTPVSAAVQTTTTPVSVPEPIVDDNRHEEQEAVTPVIASVPTHTVVDTEPLTDDKNQYQNILLEIVAEKTGYPMEMLSLDMSLDTDLGIDSIKRVEILSALQEKVPGIQQIQPEDLGTFQLLQHIVEYLADGDKQTSVSAEISASSGIDESAFQQTLLEVVADKTGYPVDMLTLDMDLDSDLGIDSIKRVEILSALQERLPDAPAVTPEDLGTLQTLQQIVEFIGKPEQTNTAVSESQESSDNETFQQTLLEVVADKTGYPVEMLTLDMNLDSDLGIDSIKRVEILSALQERLPDAPTVTPEELGELHTLQQIVTHIQGHSAIPVQTEQVQSTAPATDMSKKEQEPALYRGLVETVALAKQKRSRIALPEASRILITDDGTDLPVKIAKALEKEKLNTKIVSLNTDVVDDISGLLILAPVNVDNHFVLNAFKLMQKAGRKNIRALASVTRLGACFGINDWSSADPVTAGLHGLVKTADKEWQDVNCKAIDIPANRSSARLAAAIAEELLTDGPLEVGIKNNERLTLNLKQAAVPAGTQAKNPFTKNDVIVITGGARGVTAEIAHALAQTYGVKLLLLGRSPQPEPEPEWLYSLKTETDIKKAIISQQAADRQLTPKTVEDLYQRIRANREITNNLERLSATGAEIRYESVDIRNLGAVTHAIDEARNTLGPIRGFIHGAGVLADRLISDKTKDQFEQVYSTKITGAHNLLQATKGDDLKIMIMFSSSTSRFGRKGQADYAAANEVLNKIAQQQQRQRKNCKVLSINWGPWDGGMVTPRLKKIFQEEGVDVIPLQAGTDYLMQEITGNGPVEIVVLGSNPITETYATEETDLFDKNLELAFERKLNIRDYPVLKSHVMSSNAVLPAALIAEWLAHGAMHNNPGLLFTGFNDLRILKGVILENGETIELKIMAGQAQLNGKDHLVTVELRSKSILHAKAQIVLSSEYPAGKPVDGTHLSGDYPFKNSEYYQNGQLFHGQDLYGIKSVECCAKEGIVGYANCAPLPSKWMKKPVRSSWLADPLTLDASFQLMILWSFQNSGTGSLPTAIHSYRQFQRNYPKDDIKIIARIEKNTKHSVTATIEFIDKQENLIASIDGYECVVDDSLNEAFSHNQLELQI